MKEQAVIVLDCGATNIRAIAVSQHGKILSQKSFSNQTSTDPYFKGGLIWDADRIIKKLSKACQQVIKELQDTHILGVCTTSFGVDGAPFDVNKKQLYPVISWACKRNSDLIDEVHGIYPLHDLYHTTGLHQFDFNSIYKLYWLQKYRKDVMENMDHWLFMPSIISGHLCNQLFTDVSMAGTSMLCDRFTRRFSEKILSAFHLHKEQFPALTEAGKTIGKVTEKASREFGLAAGLPVYAAGHDTQFAIFGSGADVNEVVLSSGTWEILMVRTPEARSGDAAFKAGITIELDADPGLYNPGMQWLGSRYVEEIKKAHFKEELHREDIYELMISEAEEAISKRGIIFRKILEDLSKKTADNLKILEKNCGFQAESIIVVGGGSKNSLWNSLREDFLGIQVKTIPQAETTVLGAAMFAFAGAGIYPSPEEARNAMLQ